MNEKQFARIVQERLIDTAQVREILGLATAGSVFQRVGQGHLSGPVIGKERGYSLWDRVQVEREEAARKAKSA